MSKHISPFLFKHFSVSHHRSSMKVGVDGVLIGCWVETARAKRILDVGTGCGLIALILAQRCPHATVTGIEIDLNSYEEATENAEKSPWSDRINIINGSFPEDLPLENRDLFDLIVSNPPFFDSGVSIINTSRERARHQGRLSPSSLLLASKQLLTDGGMLAMIVPSEFSSSLESHARELGYSLMKKCLVRGHDDAPYKRVMLQWLKNTSENIHPEASVEFLTLEYSQNIPTEQYRNLCRDFYMKF